MHNYMHFVAGSPVFVSRAASVKHLKGKQSSSSGNRAGASLGLCLSCSRRPPGSSHLSVNRADKEPLESPSLEHQHSVPPPAWLCPGLWLKQKAVASGEAPPTPCEWKLGSVSAETRTHQLRGGGMPGLRVPAGGRGAGGSGSLWAQGRFAGSRSRSDGSAFSWEPGAAPGRRGAQPG